MNNTQGNYNRHERKFGVKTQDINEIFTIIKRNKSIFNEIYYERRVNSIYLDTLFNKSYYDNSFGRLNRYKIRVRWYGDNLDVLTNPNLEIKRKYGLIGDKEVFELETVDINEFLSDYENLIQKSNSDLVHKQIIKSYKPVILVSYLRRYFLSADKKYRLTVDFDLNYFDVSQVRFQKTKKIKTDYAVIELKYQLPDDDTACDITNSFPYRYSKFSKFSIGMDLVFGG